MNFSFPHFRIPEVVKLGEELRRQLRSVVLSTEAAPYVHLRSPTTGKVYKVEVDDTGTPALTITLVQG